MPVICLNQTPAGSWDPRARPPCGRGGGDEFCDEIDDLCGEDRVEELTQGGNDTKGGNQSKVECYFDRFFTPAFAAKSKGGDTLSYREAMRFYPERCKAACEKEIATLRGFNAFQEVPEDSIRCLAGSRTTVDLGIHAPRSWASARTSPAPSGR